VPLWYQMPGVPAVILIATTLPIISPS
jgi:hypothetical protein